VFVKKISLVNVVGGCSGSCGGQLPRQPDAEPREIEIRSGPSDEEPDNDTGARPPTVRQGKMMKIVVAKDGKSRTNEVSFTNGKGVKVHNVMFFDER
jgi:hypothetical protein